MPPENPMMGTDPRDATRPGTRTLSITPANADLGQYPRSIWVGGTGDIVVTAIDDPAGHAGTLIKAVPAGTLIPLAVRRVWSTNTTATFIVGFL